MPFPRLYRLAIIPCIAMAVLGSHPGPMAAGPCDPPAVQARSLAVPEDQKPVLTALLQYYDILNRKDFAQLKGVLDTGRSQDTSPGPSFPYRSFLNWRRLRVYASEVVRVEPALNLVEVRERVEAEGYNGTVFFYNSQPVYGFKVDQGRYLLSTRGTSTVDAAGTRAPFELSFLFLDTLYRGDQRGALPYIERLLEVQPDSAHALLMRGALLLQDGKHAEALAFLDRAASLPDDKRAPCAKLGSSGFLAQLHDSIGACHAAMGNQDKARRAFEQAISMNPRYTPALVHMAQLGAAAGDAAQARRWYAKAYAVFQELPEAEIALYGNPAYGDNLAGMAFMRDGKLKEAEEMFVQASKENPAYDKPYNNLGLLRERQSRPAEAIALYRQALEANPSNTAILLNLANIFTKERDDSSAKGYLKRVLEADPENLAALNMRK